MDYKDRQLTSGPQGHTINPSQVFSRDDQWIVFDSRNDDTGIGKTSTISMVNTHTCEIRELYRTKNQTAFGPGVGAATFSPVDNKVLFLHGIRNADVERPYDLTRRTGVAIDIDHPEILQFMDARDIMAPFTPGALRGGTHAHSWSADGRWISCTYNDYVLQQLSKKDSSVKDLRTVAVIAPFGKVIVPANGEENNKGDMFAAVVTRVTADPRPGTDEIDRAFDETWIGKNGYRKNNGQFQRHAIAFQGNVRDENNQIKTEIFIADIPDDITKPSADGPLQGTASTMPYPPAGVVQRRITHLKDGVYGPRHWLRSTSDGKLIAFLSKDDKGLIQVYGVSTHDGAIRQLTFNDFSVQSTFNFSPDDKYLAYIADNSIFINELHTNKVERITKRYPNAEAPVNGIVWSHDGKSVACNRYVQSNGKMFLQIFLLTK